MRTIHFLIVFFISSMMCYDLLAQRTIGLMRNTEQSLNGYTLFTVGRGTYLIDNCGYLVHQWQHKVDPGLAVYLLENGNLLRTGRASSTDLSGGGAGGLIEEYDWDGNLLWSYSIATQNSRQHHDVEPLPNGNILVIQWELKTSDEVNEAGGEVARTYWSEGILELQPVGVDSAIVVWEWHAWDHLVQDHDSTKANYGVVEDHPELMDINYKIPRGSIGGGGDWLHFNGVDYDPIRDEIIVSSRFMNEVWIIDHSTTTAEASSHTGGNSGKGGDILYRWGNPETYGVLNQEQKLFGQHDPKYIPEDYPDGGGVSIFNNGTARPEGNFSTVDIIKPPLNSKGEYYLNSDGVYGPTRLLWQYKADEPAEFFSNNRAGAHRLSNGNTLICEDNAGRFFEVNQKGDIVWDYQNTVGRTGPLTQGSRPGGGVLGGVVSIFRVTRHPSDYAAFVGRELTPDKPIEINAIDYDCTIYDGEVSVQNNIEATPSLNVRQKGITLEINNTTEAKVTAKLYNMSGQLTDQLELQVGYNYADLSLYGKGMYVVCFTDIHGAYIVSHKVSI